jgi:hypothetical protein
MIKITKLQAKKLYNNNKDIFLNPSKMNPKGVWHNAMIANKQALDNNISDAPEFEQLVNSYRYYNCSKETGLIVHFYKN